MLPPRPTATLPLWFDPTFRLYILGRVVSEVGSRITREGLPIAAVLVLAASPSSLGLLAAVSSLAAIGAAPIAGVICDRFRRRPVMIVADVLRALALATVPAAYLVGELTILHLLIVSAVVGGLTVAFRVADQAWLPRLVPDARLLSANSLVSAASDTGEIAGPTLMGGLIQALGPPLAVAVDGFTYLVSAASLLAIRSEEPAERHPAGEAASAWRDAVAGLRELVRHPILVRLALTTSTQSLFGGFFAALYELYALRTLHLTPFVIGLLVTAGGVGGLAGSLLAPRVAGRLGMWRALVVAGLVYGGLNFLVPLARGTVLIASLMLLAAQLLGDLTGSVFTVGETTVRQTAVDDRWRGRINGSVRFLESVAGALGALVAGLLAEYVGVRGALLVSAAGQTAAVLWLLGRRPGYLP